MNSSTPCYRPLFILSQRPIFDLLKEHFYDNELTRAITVSPDGNVELMAGGTSWMLTRSAK